MTGNKPAPPAIELARDAVFLDFDGCLVEIAPRPDAVVIPPDLPAMLTTLAEALDGALAVVSGRSLRDLEDFLSGYAGPMVGSHGAEARGMDPPLAESPAELTALQAELARFAQKQGLLYEEKSHGGALHFRADPTRQQEVEEFTAGLADRFPAFAIQPAKMAVELRPEGYSKDGALALLSELPDFSGRRPVYAGDDRTDEPALAWAEANEGYGIKIGEGESAARFHLPEPEDLRAWLAAAVRG